MGPIFFVKIEFKGFLLCEREGEMVLFNKEACLLCSKEVGALGRTRLADKGEKKYLCKDCVRTRVSPFVEAGYLTELDLREHLEQRKKDAALYEEVFRDFSYANLKEVFGDHPYTGFDMGEYELRKHGPSNSYMIWERRPGKGQTFDVFLEDEIQAACIWGEYKDPRSGKIIDMPDKSDMSLRDIETYRDDDMESLYLTIFTSHPFLPVMEVPLVKKGGRNAKDNQRIRERALLAVDHLNEAFLRQNEEYGSTCKKEIRKSAKEARKSLFGVLKSGEMEDNTAATVSSFLGKIKSRENMGNLDYRIKTLREKNPPRRIL